jgi:porin
MLKRFLAVPLLAAISALAIADEPLPEATIVAAPDPYESGAQPDAPLPQMPVRSGEAATQPAADEEQRFLLDSDQALGDPIGWRTALGDRGIALNASLAIDWVKVLRGGANTEGDSWLHVFNANLTLDTARLLSFKGGTFFANFQNQDGDAPSLDVGDWQGTNSDEAAGLTMINEIYYQQALLDEKVRLKAGKLDAANDFDYTDNGLEFLHNGMAWSVNNFAQPTVDTTAFGGNVFVYPCDHFYAG